MGPVRRQPRSPRRRGARPALGLTVAGPPLASSTLLDLVAQLVRAEDCGSSGRGFDSRQGPQITPGESRGLCFSAAHFVTRVQLPTSKVVIAKGENGGMPS